MTRNHGIGNVTGIQVLITSCAQRLNSHLFEENTYSLKYFSSDKTKTFFKIEPLVFKT